LAQLLPALRRPDRLGQWGLSDLEGRQRGPLRLSAPDRPAIPVDPYDRSTRSRPDFPAALARLAVPAILSDPERLAFLCDLSRRSNQSALSGPEGHLPGL